MSELMKILSFYEIKSRLFEVVTDNVSNNKTLKEKLTKTLTRRDFRWDRAQHSLSCMTHIFNLVTQNFISALESNADETAIVTLKNSQIEDVENSTDLSVVIKKISQK